MIHGGGGVVLCVSLSIPSLNLQTWHLSETSEICSPLKQKPKESFACGKVKMLYKHSHPPTLIDPEEGGKIKLLK